MKIKVVSDGTINGTTVFDAATGEPVSGVKSVTWHLDVDSITADVVIEMVGVPINVVGTTKEDDKKRLDELSKNL